MNISLLLISFLCLFGEDWEMCGPGGTQVSELCTVGNTLFTLAYYPGGYECRGSLDNGETWELLAVPEYSPMDLCSDAFGRILIPGNEYIMVSSDLGETWSTLFTLPDSYNRSVSSDPADSLHLLAATDNISYPLIESFDGGVTWTEVEELPGNVTGKRVVFCTHNPSTVYLAAYQEGTTEFLKMYKSVNSGADWTDVSPDPAVSVGCYPRFDLVVSPEDENLVSVSASHNLFLSADGGLSWSDILESYYSIEDVVLPGSTGSIYAISRDKLYRTTNLGQSWQATSLSTPYVWSLALSDFLGAERIHIGTSSGHYFTDTLASSWTQANNGLPGGKVYALLEGPDSGFPVFAGNEYFLNEEQFSWTPTGDINLAAVYHIERAASDPQLLFVAGDAG